MRYLFVHGWGFSPAFWNEFLGVENNPSTNYFYDRGYFTDRYSESNCAARADIVIAHSMGLHCISPSILKEAQVVVAIASFEKFPLQASLEQMIEMITSHPAAVLHQFYRKASSPLPTKPALAGKINSKLLLEDLYLLQQAVLSAEAYDAMQNKTLLVHGDKDLIVGLDEMRRLEEKIAGCRSVVIPEMGHLPDRHMMQNIFTMIREVLP